MQRAPVKVGEYIARVTVPAGDAQYLPGSYDVRMTIKRIVVLIYPEEASKQKGQEDPDFYYEYDESVMLEDDEVTGSLSRVKGETYGNYPYLTGSLAAPEDVYKRQVHIQRIHVDGEAVLRQGGNGRPHQQRAQRHAKPHAFLHGWFLL